MKRLFLITVLLLFTVNLFAQNNNIAVLSEYTFYPNRLLTAIDFNDIYKNPKLGMTLTLFQNNLNPKLNNGFLGIDFSAPVSIKAVSVDGAAVPDLIVECQIDNIERLSAFISTFSGNSLSVVSYENSTERLLIKSAKNRSIPILMKNKKMYLIADAAKSILLEGKIEEESIRLKKSFATLKQIADAPVVYSAQNFLTKSGKNISLKAEDVLGYLFLNITNDYLKNVITTFKLDFLKELVEESTDPQIMLITKKTKNLSVKNYIFTKPENYKLDEKSSSIKIAPKSSVVFFAGNNDITQLKKFISKGEKYSIPLDIQKYLLKFIDNIAGSFSFYINNNTSIKITNMNLKEELLAKYPLTLIFEIQNKNGLIKSIEEISEMYPDTAQIIKKNGNNILNIKIDAEIIEFYYDFIDDKNAFITTSVLELEKIKQTAESKDNLLSVLKNKGYWNKNTDNSFYYADLKQLLKDARAMLPIEKIGEKLADYIVNSFDAICGYTSHEQDLTVQTFNLFQSTELNMIEVYNMIMEKISPPPTAAPQRRQNQSGKK